MTDVLASEVSVSPGLQLSGPLLQAQPARCRPRSMPALSAGMARSPPYRHLCS